MSKVPKSLGRDDGFARNTPGTPEIHCSLKDVLIRVLLTMLVFTMMCLLISSFFLGREAKVQRPPHIIFILADDLGWNDVSFHGSPQIPTPNIDALAASGIILNKHYVAPQCTPSRASLMTGRYPTNTGLQHYIIRAGQPSGIPLNFTIMPQYLKRLGYATHLVGKWHLGYYKKEYTPTYRGFDSFFGYWNGAIDYYDYTYYGTILDPDADFWGVDLHNGTDSVLSLRGKYATELFTEKAEEIIRNHNVSQPLFLWVSQVAPHTGNAYQRLQAPEEHVEKFKHIKDMKRRKYAGVVSSLDESVGNVFLALDDKDMLDNCVIVLLSDNGAQAEGQFGGYGSNWPLKGCKLTLFEGGVRTPALIWSPLFHLQEPRTSMDMMHISDWLPTLYAAAGGNVNDLREMDGINMWNHLVNDLPLPRHEMLLNVDPIYGMSSVIMGHYKLVNGTYPSEELNSWYGPSGRENFTVSSMDGWVWRNRSVVKDILQRSRRWLLKTPDQWRQSAAVDCGSNTPLSGNGGCDPTMYPCLFNITEDPCEHHDLASQHPDVVKYMMDRILQLNSTSLEPANHQMDPMADPRRHGFSYVSWLDEEYA